MARSAVTNLVPTFDLVVRPYTLRKGDTLDSIARKRSMSTEQLLSLNPGKEAGFFSEGATILLPASKLSSRDREIIDGMGETYRVYPVRAGENLQDIMSKRGITMAEMQSLNPGIDLAAVQDNQVLRLPANKFTVREREMLIGSGILPADYFTAAKDAVRNPFVIAGLGLALVCGWVMAWQQFHKDPDMHAE